MLVLLDDTLLTLIDIHTLLRGFAAELATVRGLLFCYFLHLEGGGVGAAVFFLTQGGPVHLVTVDGDFPPLAVLHAIVYPTGA